MKPINLVTVAMVALFLIPVVMGVVRPFLGSRVKRSVLNLFHNIAFLVTLILAVWLTGIALSGGENWFLSFLYRLIPTLEVLVTGRDILVSIAFFFVFLTLLHIVVRLLLIPVSRFIVVPLSDRLSASADAMSAPARRVVGGLWELPRAVTLVLIFTLGLHFYSAFQNNEAVDQTIHESSAYQLVDNTVLEPILASGVVKQIPVLLGDSFRKAVQSAESGNILVVRYFNGMTLEDAVKSNDEIDARAKKIAAAGKTDRDKASLLYQWISKNITYDSKKAALISSGSTKAASGAIVAYTTRTGICFDYSCLYVAMCRAVNLKVRFITGLGYSGSDWGDHAWNQVWFAAENRWINVDTTFGNSGRDYFDRKNFTDDHSDAVVQGEW